MNPPQLLEDPDPGTRAVSTQAIASHAAGDPASHAAGDSASRRPGTPTRESILRECDSSLSARTDTRSGWRPAAENASVSVVICAYSEERWDDTLAAVASVRAQRLAPEEIIVVVDHNPPLYAALNAALSGVLVLENASVPGLSGGRNTGVAAASGSMVAFLDDDAVAEPDWLKFLVDRYSDPVVVGVSGFIYPMWATARPSWFPPEFDWVLGCSYRGMPELPAPVRNVMGGNASFRREVFGVVGGFRAGIGRSALGRPLGCEETEFCIRLTRQIPGSVLMFDNRARVGHRVSAERTRFAYFWSRCFAEGLSKAIVVDSVGARHGLAAERDYTLSTLPRGVVHGVVEALRGRPGGLARAGAIIAGFIATAWGYLVGRARRVSAEGGNEGKLNR
jgi:GT2 family glycosyltransferase